LFRDFKPFSIMLMIVGVLFHSNALAVIQHAGQLTQDETWDSSDTHQITGDILVPSGVTLTIEGGTTMEVNALSDSQNLGVDGTRVEIIVDGGSLRIEGSPLEWAAVFTSNAGTPQPGDWRGIRVLNGGELYMTGAEIYHAVDGVDYRQSGSIVRSPYINGNVLTSLSGAGIIIDSQAGAQVTLNISVNEIANIDGRGVDIRSSGASTLVQGSISYITTDTTGLNGVSIIADTHARHDLTIDSSTISNSGGSAVASEDGAGIRIVHNGTYSSGFSNYSVNGNEIANGSHDGIYIKQNDADVNLTIDRNQLHQNAGNGVFALGTLRTLNATIVNNTVFNNGSEGTHIESGDPSTAVDAGFSFNNIHHNAGNGVGLYQISGYDLVYNTIHDNASQGIRLSATNPGIVNFNNLYGNDATNGIALHNDGATGVDARYNWWGDAIYAEIATGSNPKNLTGLFDTSDDISKGAIDYGDWLTAAQAEPLTYNITSWFKNPVEADVITTPTFTIQGLARGTTSSSLDRVEVSTDGGTNWYPATGTDNWSYDWTISNGNGSYTLQSRAVTTGGYTETPAAGRTVTVDIVAPVELTLDTLAATTQTTPVTLSGTKSADTAIYIDSALVVALDSATTWSYDQPLTEGLNTFIIESKNGSGNTSTAVEASIILDTVAPLITNAVPADNSYVTARPSTFVYSLQEANSGLDTASIIASAGVTRNSGASVAGTWTIDGSNQLIFTPGALLTEDTYTVTATITDIAGNSTTLNSSFTYDATPPVAPTVNTVTSPTTTNTQLLQGQKESNSSLWINDTEIIPIDSSTSWSHEVSLTSGPNSFTLYSKDLANNQSTSTTVQITYDDLAPPSVDSLTVDAADIGTVAKLDWTAYDESVHGDIDGYRVYVDTSPFTDVTSMTAVANLSAGQKTHDISGLNRGQAYYFAVVAYDLGGSADNTVAPVTATTTDVVPPEEVRNLQITVGADNIVINWDHSLNSAGDLAAYKVYFNNDAGTTLAANETSHSVAGLNAATGYPITITTIDSDGNESGGLFHNAITLLANPTIASFAPLSSMVDLAWNPSLPSNFVKKYAIYISTTDFSSVAGLTPAYLLNAARNDIKVSGLTNGTTYYFAVTAINLSDGETQTVTTVSATPEVDLDGPEISNLTFAGTLLTDGATLSSAGTFAVGATDVSGVSRVEFQLDGVTLATDINGSDGYTGFWNLPDTTDGAHTVTVVAYDTLDNSYSLSRNITVALAAPEAPTITAPADGITTNLDSVTVTGSAEANSEVLVQIGGTQVAGPLSPDTNGNFQTLVTLSEGLNVITASAQNRGGTGSVSAAINVTLDTSVPDSPAGLNAQSQTEGQVLLTWNLSTDERVVSYDVYRASQSFSDIAQAVKANSNPVTTNRFVDLPLAEGVFYYRVVALNDVGTSSLSSNESSAEADSILPQAVNIDYTPLGNFDSATGRMAAGQVDVTVEVNEPLLATPFLSLTPPGGVPIAVTLSQTSETGYAGSFEITDTTPSGTAYAVFSARDRVGNRGNAIDQGATILIDTAGPAISQMTVAPSSPIKNDQVNPVDVNLEFTLDQPVKSGTLPEMNYRLSGAGRQPTAITNLVQTDALVWRGSFQLPADAGLTEVENLSFEFTAQDDLDTVSHAINTGNSHQVYQGVLPPLDVPAGLNATALPGGGVDLQWQSVDDVVEYQLYRQAPGETALTAYSRVTTTSHTDTGLTDGDYIYSVASVRQANAQESVSGQSATVTVGSDSLAPAVPENLSLELVGAGMKALWDAPSGSSEALSYNLYRAGGTSLTDVSGLTPIQSNIVADAQGVLGFIDTAPDENESTYAVTAVDAVGNESTPSTSAYLHVGLLPVSSLQVIQTDGGYPLISWSHSSGVIDGYNLYLDGSATPLNSGLITDTSYTDLGYTNNVRRYTLTAVDVNSVESLGRTVELPLIDVSPQSETGIKRGIMNRVGYVVSNLTSSAVSGVKLKVDVEGHLHTSSAFELAAGESRTVEMIIGGFDTLPDNATLQTVAEITAATGERAEIVENGQIAVGDASLLAQVETQELTRGANGQIRFSLENSSDVVTEIITAQGSNPTPEITLLLEDLDGNVLATAPFMQQVGSGVLTLSSGNTVARIEPGVRFTSDWFSLPIPESAPDQVRIRLQIDQLHYQLGQSDHLAIAGLGTSQDGVLSDTAYTATIDSVTPASSYGDQPILISGQALERATAQPLAQVPLKLVIVANGFERQAEITTDSSGSYQYQFDPLPAESGIFTVSAVHPDILARPGQGQFTINRVLVKPTTLRLNLPKNVEQSFDVIQAVTGEGTTATNLRLVYEAADQSGGTFPTGMTVNLGSPQTLSPEQSGKLSFSITGDNSADLAGTIVLKVMSDESGSEPLALVNLEYALSDADPALYFSPNFLETGVAHNASVNETITLENRGLAELTDVHVTLLTDAGAPAPDWIYLLSPQSQGDLAIGESKQIQLTASPDSSIPDSIYAFKLRVESSNYQVTDINIYVAVTQSGIGNALFKASDIYTATLDENGDPIPGLTGARIRIQNEEVLTIEQTATTDSYGEALISDLPAGRYRFRASAPNHEDLLGRLTIKPGVTTAQEIFLDFNLITVEWSVTEITIQDKYEITLQATFETDVPAAVIVLEPSSTTLPDMAVGDVFYGELRLTNHGLIRADNLRMSYPSSDAYFQYEFLAELPDTLEAKESLLIPYRITALAPLSPDGTGSGGGCIGYATKLITSYFYVCANGDTTGGSTTHSWTYPVSLSGCGATNTGSSIWYGGSPGVGVGQAGGSMSYSSLPGAKCLPTPGCGTTCSTCGPNGG
jgi:hypothetical protein